YLLEERGVAWFRQQVESYLGRALQDPLPVEVTGIEDHLGWHEQGDGRWFRGVWVENGRIIDREGLQLRTAIREVVSRLGVDVHLTTQQNLLLVNIQPEDRAAIDDILRGHGVLAPEDLTEARRWAMACPAIPTCPLAVAESERVLPAVIDELEVALARIGLADETLTVRMTGCPNGCAR